MLFERLEHRCRYTTVCRKGKPAMVHHAIDHRDGHYHMETHPESEPCKHCEVEDD